MFHFLFIMTYMGLMGAFLVLMYVLERPFPETIPLIDFLFLSLATFRITELITCDVITKFIRDPFIKREEVRQPDGSVDTKVKPKGRGLKRYFGQLIICPWCVGVWVGSLLTYFYLLFTDFARVFLLAMAAVAAGIIIELFTKVLDKGSDKLAE